MLICSNGWTQLVIDRGFQKAGFCILKFTMSNNKRVSILMQVEPLSWKRLYFILFQIILPIVVMYQGRVSKHWKNIKNLAKMMTKYLVQHIDFWLAKTRFYRLDPSLNPIQCIRCDFFYYSTMFSYQQLPTSATIQKSFSDFVYFLFLNWADLTGQKNSQIKSYKYLTFLLHSWCSQICSLSDFESRIFQPDSYYEGGGPIETSM